MLVHVDPPTIRLTRPAAGYRSTDDMVVDEAEEQHAHAFNSTDFVKRKGEIKSTGTPATHLQLLKELQKGTQE